MRHLRDFENTFNKDSYCLFIAPKIHIDTLNTFWFSVKYEYQGKKIGTGIMNKLIEKINEYKKMNPEIRTYLGASKGKESFYEKFGFVSRPNEELGAGMILYDK